MYAVLKMIIINKKVSELTQLAEMNKMKLLKLCLTQIDLKLN